MDNELKVLLTSQYDGLRAGFTEAEGVVTNAIGHMKSQFASMNTGLSELVGSLGRLGPMIAGALSVEGFKKATEAAFHYNESIHELIESMGMTGEQASVMNTALNMIGKTAEEYVGINFRLGRAVKSNEKGLNDLGVATRDANHKFLDQNVIFQNVITEMMKYKEGSDRMGFAINTLGRGARQLIDYHLLTAEVMAKAKDVAEKYGLILGEDDVAATKKLRISTNEISMAFSALWIKIGQELLPELGNFAKWFGEVAPPVINFLVGQIRWLVVAFDALKTAVVQAVAIMVGAFRALYDTASIPIRAIAMILQGDFSGAFNVVKKGFSDVATDVKVGLKEAGIAGDEFWERTKKRWETPVRKPKEKEGLSFEGKEGKEPKSRMSEWKDELEKRVESERGANQAVLDIQEEFWRDKWLLTEIGSKEEREVEHQQFEVRKKQELEYYETSRAALEADMARTKATWAEKLADQDKNIALAEDIFGKGSKKAIEEENKKNKMLEEQEKYLFAIRDKYRKMEEDSTYTSWARRLEIEKESVTDTIATFGKESEKYVEAIDRQQKKTEEAAKAGLKDELDAIELKKADTADIKEKIALTDRMMATILKSNGLEIERYRSLARERTKLVQEGIDQEITAKVKAIDVDLSIANQSAKAKETDIRKRAELGFIGTNMELKMLQDLEDARYALELKELQREADLWKDHPIQYQAMLDKIKEATERNKDTLIKLNTEVLGNSVAKFDEVFGTMTSGFSSGVKSIVSGAQSMGGALKGIWNGIASGFIDMTIKMGLHWVGMQLKNLLFSQTTNAAMMAGNTARVAEEAAAEEAAAMAKIATQDITGVAEVMSEAAVGAAAAMASTAAIPMVGPALAPAAGATMFTMIAAMAPLATAAGGFDVDKDQLTFVHSREMVLPANIAEGLRGMIGGGGGGGGPSVFAPKVYAFDSKGVDRVLKSYGTKFFKEMDRQLRGQNLPRVSR